MACLYAEQMLVAPQQQETVGDCRRRNDSFPHWVLAQEFELILHAYGENDAIFTGCVEDPVRDHGGRVEGRACPWQ